MLQPFLSRLLEASHPLHFFTNQAVGSDSELLVLNMLLTVEYSNHSPFAAVSAELLHPGLGGAVRAAPAGRRGHRHPPRRHQEGGARRLILIGTTPPPALTCWLLLRSRGGHLPCPDLIVRSMHVWWLVGVLDRCWSEFPGTCRDRRSRLGDVLLYIISYYAMAPACSLWVAVCQ